MKRRFRRLSLRERATHVLWVAWCTYRMWALVAWETLVVMYLIRRMKGGAIEADHPWASGHGAGGAIWPKNIVYRSPTRLDADLAHDEEAVSSVGRFLALMVRRSTRVPEIPQGPKRRMPHAVNYLHGAIHHNGAFLVFDDFGDVIAHLTDPRFRRDLIRFARRERREVTLVLRTRTYDPLDYAYCIGCVRTMLPWFSNGNGPTRKPVLWGNHAPYPAIALINGAWMADTCALMRADTRSIVRAPVAQAELEGPYVGTRDRPIWLDRVLAWQMYLDVKTRGFRGQLAFTDRRLIEPHRIREYESEGGYGRWTACYPVPHPFQRDPKGDGIEER